MDLGLASMASRISRSTLQGITYATDHLKATILNTLLLIMLPSFSYLLADDRQDGRRLVYTYFYYVVASSHSSWEYSQEHLHNNAI